MKTTVKTIAAQILETKKLVTEKQKFIEGLIADLASFKAANESLNEPINQEIKNDAGLLPSDVLAEIERLQALEVERLQKLSNVEKTLKLFETRISQNQLELQKLLINQEVLQNEQAWTTNYLPECKHYESSFIEAIKEKYSKQIADVSKQLAEAKENIGKLKNFIANPNNVSGFVNLNNRTTLFYADCDSHLRRLEAELPRLESQLDSLSSEQSEALENLYSDSKFRKFIQDRVDINQLATELFEAQNQYLAKLEAVKVILHSGNTKNSAVRNYDPISGNIITVKVDDYLEIRSENIFI